MWFQILIMFCVCELVCKYVIICLHGLVFHVHVLNDNTLSNILTKKAIKLNKKTKNLKNLSP